MNGERAFIGSAGGPETAFVEDILDVISRHSQRLSAYQLTGGLTEVIQMVLAEAKED